ncbi:Histone-lysine N-methyltransferase SUVR4-like protein [Drosera capensis]
MLCSNHRRQRPSVFEMEKEEEPPAKRLHVEAADGEVLKREDNAALRDTTVGAPSNLCLGHGGVESGGGQVRDVPCVDEMEVKDQFMSKTSGWAILPIWHCHSSSVKGASTKNGNGDLVGNRFDNGNSKFSSHSSVLGEGDIPKKCKCSSESGVNSNFGTTRQSSVEAITQDGLDCSSSSSEGCLMPKISDVVLHEKEPGNSTSPGAKANKKEPRIPDKQKPHPVANGQCKGKGKKSSAQDKGLVNDDGIWELSLQEYKNQGTVSDKKKLVFAADVANGKEKVKIPIVGDDGNEDYLNFCYIATNLIYQDASVSVSLARISDEDCCVDC